jgi:peptidoglycan-associated lipoprotein
MKLHRSLPSLVLALGLAGCATTPRNSVTTTDVTKPTPSAPAPVADRGQSARPAPDTASESLEASPIYFTLDSATLTPEGQDTLVRLAEALRQRPEAQVTVSGHTCELGTTEYNLALGQRRADIVRTYLVRMGVEPRRIAVISYGEEKPTDERTLERNRRTEFSFRVAEQARVGTP